MGRQQDAAGQHRKCCRKQRPPEARRMTRPVRREQSADAADQEHPAQDERDRKARKRRRDHRGDAEDRKQDALEQEGLPMRLHPRAHFGLQLVEVVGKGHCSSPGKVTQRGLF
jgi:hypothetical protein